MRFSADHADLPKQNRISRAIPPLNERFFSAPCVAKLGSDTCSGSNISIARVRPTRGRKGQFLVRKHFERLAIYATHTELQNIGTLWELSIFGFRIVDVAG